VTRPAHLKYSSNLETNEDLLAFYSLLINFSTWTTLGLKGNWWNVGIVVVGAGIAIAIRMVLRRV
jgi:hypothetical protein